MDWLDRLLTYRDGLVSRPTFQRWAASFLLTRPIARAQERRLFSLVSGFVHSQVLTACVRLDIFDLLAVSAKTPSEIAEATGLALMPTERLLEAATALGLLERRSRGRVGLGLMGAALRGNPGVVAMIEHHDLLYRDLSDPVALLRGSAPTGTALARYWGYAQGAPPPDVDAYSALMATSNGLVSADVLDAWPLASTRCLMDVGGGEGAFLTAALARAPGLRGILFDLPSVVTRARGALAAQGLLDRVTCHGGDFRTDALPEGADLITLVRVLHDHEDDTVRRVLGAARRALAPGGTLLVAEPMAGVSESVTAYFLFYLLAMGSGRPRTPDALTALLHEAGFSRVRIVATRRPLLVRLLAATP